MFRISCFADEISSDLNTQIEVMKRNNVKYVELRSVWDKNVLALDDNEIKAVKKQLDANGIKISSIGSPIGKVDIKADFDLYLPEFMRAVNAAQTLETKYIRIFSFYMKREELDIYSETVTNRLKTMLDIAGENGITLLHENEAGIYGESSKRCALLLNTISSTGLRAVFDPANFAVAGEDVLNVSFRNVKSFVEYFHVKDFSKGTGKVVIAGKGDGHIPEILNELRGKENMFVSMEPHLAVAGTYRGFSGPELFEDALNALKGILADLKIDYI